MINEILIICVGNICRSPMAEGLMKASLPGWAISSAGMGALVGQPAEPVAIGLMRERGIDISGHRARQLDMDMMYGSDLILVMEKSHQIDLERQFPFILGKTFLMCESMKADVTDPYMQGREAFINALGLIAQGADAWSRRILSFDSVAQQVTNN